jgi:hypothetical protein
MGWQRRGARGEGGILIIYAMTMEVVGGVSIMLILPVHDIESPMSSALSFEFRTIDGFLCVVGNIRLRPTSPADFVCLLPLIKYFLIPCFA